MPKNPVRMCLRVAATTLVLVFSLGGMALAQQAISQPSLMAFTPAPLEPVINSSSVLPEAPVQHSFWDKENRLLFSATAMLCAADFSVTHMNLANGGRELNPIVRPFAGNSATLAANFAGQTAGVVAISYLFHRTGHHRLERMTPTANLAASAFGVAYGLSHR